jgi:predicted secreted protein
MNIVSGFAIYFVIWWIVLFAVLPFDVASVGLNGETVELGHDPGAPVKPHLVKKAIVTTLISALLFLLGWWLLRSGIVDLERMSFFGM